MKKTFILFIFAAFFFVPGFVWAQNNDNNHQDRWERYRSEKIAFLTNKLDLSPTEAQKFWPVYNEMDKERSEVQQERRDLDRQVREATETLSDKEIIKLTRDYASNAEKEGSLATKYNEQFLKILPPQKVLKLYKAENEFRMYMFRKYRDQRGKEDGE
ncbi:MAG TPA: hypothetical protein PK335_09870 [Draconibacterium sp.]|nr:hypothetical protein [Draconibacterium sp.]